MVEAVNLPKISFADSTIIAPGKGYSIFAGKDASKALGKSSLKIEDCDSDISELTDSELKVLDDWLAFYMKVLLSN